MKTKEKYLLMAAVMGICTAGISLNCVWAADASQQTVESSDSDEYLELGDSEEEQAYRKFLENGENFSDVEDLGMVMYAAYDINNDKTKELIVRGMDSDNAYRYLFYRYEDGEVKSDGSMTNWQNGGEGEMYYIPDKNVFVVYMRLADHKKYKIYQLKDTVEQRICIHRQSLDVQGADGKYHREYAYSVEKPDKNESTKTITEKEWNKFESSLVEIPFYDYTVKADTQFSEEQIAALKKSLGVPDEITVSCEAGEPFYWEAGGRWLVSMGLYDENGTFLAGAEIDPDTLELEREIAPYNADAIAGQNEPAQQSVTTPFYGIWCYGGKSEEDADAYAQSMRSSGYDAQVFVTTDWSNLNPEKFYVVTAGIYQSESEANAALASAQSFCADAYVKYSGDFQG